MANVKQLKLNKYQNEHLTVHMSRPYLYYYKYFSTAEYIYMNIILLCLYLKLKGTYVKICKKYNGNISMYVAQLDFIYSCEKKIYTYITYNY